MLFDMIIWYIIFYIHNNNNIVLRFILYSYSLSGKAHIIIYNMTIIKKHSFNCLPAIHVRLKKKRNRMEHWRSWTFMFAFKAKFDNIYIKLYMYCLLYYTYTRIVSFDVFMVYWCSFFRVLCVIIMCRLVVII